MAFTDLSSGDVANRSWSFGDGATSNLADPVHTFTSPGSYMVSLVASGGGGSERYPYLPYPLHKRSIGPNAPYAAASGLSKQQYTISRILRRRYCLATLRLRPHRKGGPRAPFSTTTKTKSGISPPPCPH
ncbi:MAG: PKD domain-containing protein [Thermodesulfobacteriota bacterium]